MSKFKVALAATAFIVTGLFPLLGRTTMINGSFENPNNTFVPDPFEAMVLSPGSTAIPGWSVYGQDINWVYDQPEIFGLTGAKDGHYFIDFSGYHNDGLFGGVSQTFATTPGHSYHVSFDIGYGAAEPYSFDGRGPISITASYNGNSAGVFTSAADMPEQTTWEDKAFDFVATSTATELGFEGLSSVGCCNVFLDNVAVTEAKTGATPVAGTLWLVLLALAGAGLQRTFEQRVS